MQSIQKITLRTLALGLVMSALSVTSCRQDSDVATVTPVSEASTKSARLSCTAKLSPDGSNFSLGTVPKLAPVASGEAEFNNGGDCDYFVAFQQFGYTRIVVADVGDAATASEMRRMIREPKELGGLLGGFGNSLGRGKLSTNPADTRTFVIIGLTRANRYLGGIAANKGTTVRALLAKHLRLGNP